MSWTSVRCRCGKGDVVAEREHICQPWADERDPHRFCIQGETHVRSCPACGSSDMPDDRVVFGTCCDCGEDIYTPKRRRCPPCAAAKYL